MNQNVSAIFRNEKYFSPLLKEEKSVQANNSVVWPEIAPLVASVPLGGLAICQLYRGLKKMYCDFMLDCYAVCSEDRMDAGGPSLFSCRYQRRPAHFPFLMSFKSALFFGESQGIHQRDEMHQEKS